MPGMQSLKALLLFVKEQCGFSPPLHRHHYTIIDLVSSSLGRGGGLAKGLCSKGWSEHKFSDTDGIR